MISVDVAQAGVVRCRLDLGPARPTVCALFPILTPT